MAEYHAKAKSLSFILTQNDKLIGKLIYKGWFKFDALVEIAGKSNYQVEPKGFWGTTIELKDNEKVLLQFKMNWSGKSSYKPILTTSGKGMFLSTLVSLRNHLYSKTRKGLNYW